MGTIARTGLPGVLIGNTAEKVLDDVHCSVVAVKPPGFVSPLSAQTLRNHRNAHQNHQSGTHRLRMTTWTLPGAGIEVDGVPPAVQFDLAALEEFVSEL